MPYGRRGGEFVVNKQLAGIQFAPVVAGFESGGFIVVWNTLDPLQDGAGRAIKAQRYDSLGNAVGAEVLINTAAAGDQRAPSVTTLASGGYVVTWETTDTTQDGSGLAIKGQLFDASGAAVGPEFRVNSQLAADQINSSVTGLDGGGFVVTWQTTDPAQDGHTDAIKGQIYSAAGVAVGGEFLVNTGALGNETNPEVTSLAGGGFVATWTRGSGTSADIYAQVFNASGAKTGGQFLVNSTTLYNQDFASVTQISGGRFVVAWQSSASLTTLDTEIRARIFSADGTPLGNDFLVSTTRTDPATGFRVGAADPTVEDLPNGGFVITWNNSAGDYVRSWVRAQYFDSAGSRVGSELIVNTVTDRFEERPDVAVDGNGMLFTVWGSYNQNFQDSDIRGQIFSPSGAPEIVSNGGGDTATVNVAENQTAVTTVSAVDPDGPSGLVFSIVAGRDASRFAINASTGALTFLSPPNFEARVDADTNGVYDVVVMVSDGVMSDIQALSVVVANVNEAPTISGSQTAYFHRENGTAVASFSATDPDGTAVTWSIAGGADAARFAIDPASGALRFLTAPNYEAPTDVGADNFYNVIIAASDGSLSATRALTIEIANLNEGPVIVSGGGGDTAAFSIPENTGSITTIVADDPDAQDSPFTFSIVGGADAAFFSIGQNGLLLFNSNGRNFEVPTDADHNNVYEVIVAVGDGFNPADTQAISVTVTDANDAPVITSNGGSSSASLSLIENQTVVTTVTGTDADNNALTYAIAGGADSARFTIDAATGLLSFVSAPDREAPSDVGANNVYNVTVSVSDGAKSATQALSITVLDANEAPIIASNGGGDVAAIAVIENGLAVTNVAAADPEGKAVSYAIAGGVDASRFLIDSGTGALTFVTAPDREQPGDSDGNNVYEVVVRASDGTLSDSQALSITVGNANERPIIVSNGGGSSASLQIDEGRTSVTTVAAADPDGAGTLIYSISGGAHAGLFVIDSATGALSFAAAPDYEAPLGGSNNVYSVTVSASDGELSSFQSIQIAVRDVQRVSIVSNGGGDGAEIRIGENRTGVTTVGAVDDNGLPLTYTITGGEDSAKFSIDPQTGVLSFVTAPDYERPDDYYGDNKYLVQVTASDGTVSDTQEIVVHVDDVDEAPIFSSFGGQAEASTAIVENTLLAANVRAEDPDGPASMTYAIGGGADAGLFEIDPGSGELRFRQAPDFEAPADSDGDNVYEVAVTAYSGALSSTQALAITIDDEEENVAITSNGGGDSASLSVAENGTAVTVVAASGPGSVTYAIVGGADSADFTIDASTGALAFASSPDFEGTADSDHDNVYEVIVRAGNGTTSDDQHLSINLTNVDDSPEFFDWENGSTVQLWAIENRFHVGDPMAFDPDGGPAITYAITGGADAAFFAIDPNTASLTFLNPQGRDFEAPADAGGDNVYDLEITAYQGSWSRAQAFSVTVENENERPRITSDGGGTSAALDLNEGQTAVTTVVAQDPDGADTLTYSITGGFNADLFTIDPVTGALSFVAAPDYEAPAEGSGNFYTVEVTASDGELSTFQKVQIQVRNVNEGVTITAQSTVSIAENNAAVTSIVASDADGDPVRYAIAGGADSALFAIDPQTGALSFVTAPNFEAPSDTGGDNVYDVTISATDGSFTDTKALKVSVGNVNEAVAITSNGGGASASVAVAENGSAVTIVAASDPDGGAVTYAIAGGADAARFTINASTGALAFVAAPNFEVPADAGANNVYDVVVSASDGSFTDTQAIAVTVGNVNEAPVITSNGAGAGAAVAVAENGIAVTTVAAADPEGGALTYAIAGGADASRFTINAVTGILSFLSAPNYEAPADVGGNNVYDVIVSASDGSFTDTQALAVTVGNVNEAPVITSNGGGASATVSIAENGAAVAVVAASDPDGTPATYSIVGGADAARFTINPQTGALQFIAAPDYELPGDSNGDNIYAVIVRAGDGQYTDDQSLSVSVTNLRDGNNVTGTSGSDSISATSTNPALRTSNAEDVVFGRDGHDDIQGMAGDDDLYGEAGNDVLVGGAGADRLTGGLGKDTFTYNMVSDSAGASRDLITDFSHAQGDKISLSAIDANSLLSNNQAFTFIGSAAFSNVAGQLRFETSGGITTISGDVNGDGVADLQIQLSGTVVLVSSDFVL